MEGILYIIISIILFLIITKMIIVIGNAIYNILPCKHKNYREYRAGGDGFGQCFETGKRCKDCGLQFDINEFNSRGQFLRYIEYRTADVSTIHVYNDDNGVYKDLMKWLNKE